MLRCVRVEVSSILLQCSGDLLLLRGYQPQVEVQLTRVEPVAVGAKGKMNFGAPTAVKELSAEVLLCYIRGKRRRRAAYALLQTQYLLGPYQQLHALRTCNTQ